MFHCQAGDVLSADRTWSQIAELWARVDQAVFISENGSWVQKWKLGPKMEVGSKNENLVKKERKFGGENGSFKKMEIWSRKWTFGSR